MAAMDSSWFKNLSKHFIKLANYPLKVVHVISVLIMQLKINTSMKYDLLFRPNNKKHLNCDKSTDLPKITILK